MSDQAPPQAQQPSIEERSDGLRPLEGEARDRKNGREELHNRVQNRDEHFFGGQRAMATN